ncbi:MAG: hypothetical protein EA397_09965 [Deltaproteobacteria bacterium]|nr:MAG: hypothetical protein EA397_09965 [Deltaproteobacteria bacterium]
MRKLWTILHAISAGALGGSGVGVAEFVWLIFAGQPFDGLAAAWAWILYGACGATFGALVGLVLALLAQKWPRLRGVAGILGAWAGLAGLVLVVGPYLLNRDLFDEQGLAWWGWVLVATLTVAPLPTVVSAWRAERPPVPDGRPALGLLVPWALIGGLLVIGPILRPPAAPEPLPPVEQAPEGAGVLILLVDTLRADAVASPGQDLPHLARLRADSVSFSHAWSAAAWTRPSVATILTSRLPSGHTTSTKSSRLPASLTTLSEHLAEASIPSAAFVNNVNITASFGFDQGFSRFTYLPPDYPFGANDAVFALSLYKLIHRIDAKIHPDPPVTRAYHPASTLFEQALPWIKAHRGRQHLTFVQLMEPHDPYFRHELQPDGSVRTFDGFSRSAHPRPAPALAEDLKRRYAGEVEHLDRQLGAFLDTLRQQGLYDDLVIVLTSDHGEEFHERGGWWHGDSLHREQTQVPLWIKLPNSELAGAEADFSVRTLDVAPTIARVLDLEPHESWEGEHLLGSNEREALHRASEPSPLPEVDPATACRAQRGHPLDRVVIHEEHFAGNRLWGVRKQRMALLRSAPEGKRSWPERALFDTLEDPEEQRDVLLEGLSICARNAEDWAEGLETLLARVRDASARGAPADLRVDFTEAERQRLCALGYLSGSECRR